MSHSNVTKGMTGTDVNSDGKPYHDHADKTEHKHDVEQKKHEPHEHHPDAKEHTPHGHNNQFHKDIKGSVGSGSSELGDHKEHKESS